MDARGFIEAGLKKKGLSHALASVGAFVTGPIVKATLAIRGHKHYNNSTGIDVIKVDEISDEFDGLWQRKRGERNRLLACRSAQSIRWHFNIESLESRTRFLVCRKRDGLAGYATIMRDDVLEIGLKRLKIIDLFVANDDEEVIDELLKAAFDVVRSDGCQVLELIGLPVPIRQNVINRHRPLSRSMPSWPIFF